MNTTTPAPWPLRRPRLVAVGLALVPVVFTAAGSAIGQVLELPATTAMLVTAAAAAVSALVGLLIVRAARPAAATFGLRAPRRVNRWLYAPLAATVAIALATGGVSTTAAGAAAILALTAAVAVNEEVFFRGLVLTALRSRGVGYAIVGSSILFGVLHLSALAGGISPLYSALQVVFAALFGVVAAQVVTRTGSLAPAIAWHLLYDAASSLGGDVLNAATITGALVNIAVLAATAIVLARRA